MDINFIKMQMPVIIDAMILTLEIALWGIVGSSIIGLIGAMVHYYKVKIIYPITKIYIEISRNTPLLVQLFFLYFGLPKLGVILSGKQCAIVGLIFLGGSYMIEALRSGFESIDKVQIESAVSLGLNKYQVMRYVILPQAIKVSIPMLTANFIFLIKETSVVGVVALPELVNTTYNLISIYYKTTEMLLLLTLSYLMIIAPVSIISTLIERRLGNGKLA